MIKLIDLVEKHMTPSKKKEKEHIVKGMKKTKGDFKKRYGKDAEKIMYASATKKAMDEATFTSKYDDSPKLKGKQNKLPDELQAKLVKESNDHEVAMAQASLKSIIRSASQLMSKLGNMERDIPGWIQDHITNAENYIDQASQGFHELNDNE